MTYDLRRLRARGLIARIPHTHRYTITDHGLHTAMLLSAVHDRFLPTGSAHLTDHATSPPLRAASRAYQAALETLSDTVANEADGGVSVIDPSANTVTNTIAAGTSPEGIAYDPANGDLYATEVTSDVAVIDPTTNTTVTLIPGIATTSDDGIAVDPADGDLYVTGTRLGDVAVINPDTNAFDYTITVPGGPDGLGGDLHAITYDPADGDFYVTDADGGATSTGSGSGSGSVAAITPAG